MYKLLWIINLSEVQNSSYALIKGKFEQQLRKNTRDCKTKYATREDIHKHIEKLEEYDCIIFGSNCFRDIVLWELFNTEEIKEKMSRFIRNEKKACIFMHQLLADNEECKLFSGIDNLDFSIKRRNETETETGLVFTTEYNNYKLYPNNLDEREIYNSAKDDPFQAGVFWESFCVNEDFWNTVIQTQEGNSIVRVSKFHKVILSNMLLDEQWHFEVVENMIVNLLSSGINVGIVSDGIRKDFSYMALINELERKHIYFTEYSWNNSDELCALEYRIENNIHTSVIIDGDDDRIKNIKEKCLNNRNIAKSIQYRIDDKNQNMIMATEGISNEKLNYLLTELEIQKALGAGLIENSFSTTMKIINFLLEASREQWKNEEDKTKCPNYNERKYVQIIEDKIKQNCKANGSYDDSFGATCQMIWYYNIAKDDRKKKKAQSWLIEKYKKYYKEIGGIEGEYNKKRLGIREVLDCFNVCEGYDDGEINILEEEKEHIELIQNQLINVPEYYSTYDLIAVFNFGFRINHYELMCNALNLAIRKELSFDERLKVCLCITKLLKNITREGMIPSSIQCEYEKFLSQNTREMRNWSCSKDEEFLMKRLEISYLLCEYDDLQKIPQNIIIKMVDNDQVSFDYQQCKKTILDVQDFRIDNYEKTKQIEKLEKRNKRLNVFGVVHYVSTITMLFVLYVCVWIIVWLVQNNQFKEMFEAVVVSMWEYHSAIIVFLVGVIKYTFQKWFAHRYKRKEDEEGV